MRRKSLHLVAHALLLLCGSLLLTLVVLPPMQVLWSDGRLVIANLLPIGALLFLIYCISGRVFSSIGIVGVLIFAIRYVHDSKISILQTPLISSDFLLFGQLFVSPDLAAGYLGWSIILGVGFLLLVIVLAFYRETPSVRLRNRSIVLALFLLIFIPVSTTAGRFYTELPQNPWEPDPSLLKVGILAYLIQDYVFVKAKHIPTADKSVIAEAKARFQLPDSVPASGHRPDIVLWLSESFIDPRIIKEINSCEQVPNFCNLIEENFSRSITVPAYGGETIRTEFEILTGVPMKAVAEHYYPYMSLTHVPINSIAWELRNHGYETVAVHNHQRRFWRRPEAMRNLGFQRWIGVREMKEPRLIGRYHADSMLTDAVIDLLQIPEDSSPRLIFAISMQAHGPYGDQPRLPEDAVESIAVPKELQSENVRTLQEFFYHLNSADKELQRVFAYIKSRKRPTLLVYFGDHLPGLSNVYYDLNFVDGLGPRQQKLPLLVLSNYEIQSMHDLPQNLAAWQIPTLTLKFAGLLGEGVFAWFDLLYEQQNWSQEAAGECLPLACNALRQFQYQQLAGPEPGT